MHRMTGLQRIRAAINFQEPDRVPVWPSFYYATTRLLGMTVREYATDGKKMAQALITGYRELGYDGVLCGVDATVEGEAVGSRIRQPEDDTAFVVEPVLKDPADLDKLKIPDPHKDGRMPVIVEATQICSKKIGKEALVAASGMGPWSGASQVRGVEQFMYDIYERPDFVHDLLEFMVDVDFEFYKVLVDSGAVVIGLGEALCSPNFISPKHYQEFAVPHQKKLIKKLKDYGTQYILIHICGNTHPILQGIVSTGADLVDIDWQVNITRMIQQIDNNMAARGNLNPAGALLLGSPQEVTNESKKLIEEAEGWYGFILGSGCDVAKDTPIENIRVMVEASKLYGRYPLKDRK